VGRAPRASSTGLRELRHLLCIVSERCNLACATCYAAGAADSHGTLTPKLALAALELALGSTEAAELAVSFTGGEPLLAGPAFYERVLTAGEAIAERCGRRVRWEIQSNLLCLATGAGPELDDAWLELLGRHRVALGASIDGPPALQERHRPGATGTIAIWRELAAAGRPPGVLCVLSAESHRQRDELLAFFRELAPPTLKLAALRPLGRGASSSTLTPESLLELRLLFACALLDGGESFDPDLYLHLRYLHEGRPEGERGQSCTAVRCGAGVTSLSLDWDGTLHPCIQPARVRGHAIGSAERGLHPGLAARLAAFHGSEAWTVRCFGCAARQICFFGCRAVAIASPASRELECGFTRGLWRWLRADPARARALFERLETLRARLEHAELASIYVPRPRETREPAD
jgi:radical SAM protein with 4Fe4S-binding SPASM domain